MDCNTAKMKIDKVFYNSLLEVESKFANGIIKMLKMQNNYLRKGGGQLRKGTTSGTPQGVISPLLWFLEHDPRTLGREE